MKGKRGDWGMSLMEMLLVVALLALLSVGGLSLYSQSLRRARDSRRLADMNELGLVLDNYLGDNGCYPESLIVNQCGGTGLRPYLDAVSCDPTDNDLFRYKYVRENCKTYRIYLRLENETNELIDKMGCREGCGPGADKSFNYFVTSGNVVE